MNYTYHVAEFYAGSLNKLYGYASVVAWNNDVPVGSIALSVAELATAKLHAAGTYLAKLGATDVVHAFGATHVPADPDLIDQAEGQRYMIYVWSTPTRVSYWRHPIYIADDGTVVADLVRFEERPVNGGLCATMTRAWVNPLDVETLESALDVYGANVMLR